MTNTFENPWWQQPPRGIDPSIAEHASAHQNNLTKPQGSLGQLEDIAIRLAGIQQTTTPAADQIGIYIFAADHGVVEEGISAFPQSVTTEMLKNFASGGAAISVLSNALDAELVVVNVGSLAEESELPDIVHRVVAKGSANICNAPAMSSTQFEQAMNVGAEMAEHACFHHYQLFIGGDMGIGNTTIASAIACHLTDTPPQKMAGPGTGLDHSGIIKKQQVITDALTHHQDHIHTPEDVLINLGGFEITALTGAYIRAAQLGIAVLVDGFICSSAALAAVRINPEITPYLFFCHQSAEPGHQAILNALDAKTLLNLGLHLGEGSGSASAAPLFRLACSLHNEMATFTDANVSEKIE